MPPALALSACTAHRAARPGRKSSTRLSSRNCAKRTVRDPGPGRARSLRPWVPGLALPRSPGNDREWLNACRGGPAGGANFAFSARVTETVLLGNVAARAGQRLTWDPGARRITNADAANQHLGRAYRTGWEI